ncbi:MAG: hypothetical protein JWQ44_13 [Chthoniobacter sp.]|jgi:hypothetical protein|nr:hypothetical protein [Chthoniobacter sp.]
MAETLTCPQCNYANEPERVYCHNCGSKLDRTLLPTDKVPKKHETAEKARKRIKRMTNPGGNIFVREVKALFRVLIWAAIAAALVLMARRPEGVPEGRNELATRMVQSELGEAIESPAPRAIGFTEADINSALKQSIKKVDSVVPGIKFERAFVTLLPGTVRLTTERTIFGFSMFSSIQHLVEMKDGKFAPVVNGGSVGRLQIHPQVMKYLDYPFRGFWTALKREKEQVQKIQRISVTKGQVVLVTKGAAAR